MSSLRVVLQWSALLAQFRPMLIALTPADGKSLQRLLPDAGPVAAAATAAFSMEAVANCHGPLAVRDPHGGKGQEVTLELNRWTWFVVWLIGYVTAVLYTGDTFFWYGVLIFVFLAYHEKARSLYDCGHWNRPDAALPIRTATKVTVKWWPWRNGRGATLGLSKCRRMSRTLTVRINCVLVRGLAMCKFSRCLDCVTKSKLQPRR